MTLISVKQQIGSVEIHIQGHAEYNLEGPDIVCSACSILSYTLLQCLLEMESERKLKIINQEVSDGDVYIKSEPFKKAQNQFNTIMRTIISGFALLEQQYPEHVRIESNIS